MTTGTALPASPEELEEFLNSDEKMNAIQAEGGLPQFIQSYLGAWRAKNTEMIRQMREQSQVDYQDFMRDQAAQGFAPSTDRARLAAATPAKGMKARQARAVAMSRLRDAGAEAVRQRLFSAEAPGAPENIDDSPYASNLKKFLYATIKGEAAARHRGDEGEIEKLREFRAQLSQAWDARVRNALGERVPSEGGFLVPETLRSEILMVALEDEVMKPRATIIPMDSLRVPFPSIDDTSHVNNVFGGVQGYWTEEGASLQASAPSFSRVMLEARKLTAYTAIPNELLQDSVTPLDVWFDQFFPQALAFFHDIAFISGNGVGEPEGIINAPGAVTISALVDNHIVYADICAMFAQMWPASLKRSIWLAAPDTIPELAQLAVSGQYNNAGAIASTVVAPPVFLPGNSAENAPGGISDGRSFTLMGRPGFISEKIPALANGTSTAGALTLVDPSYYLIGDRQAMQVATSTEYLFGSDETAYRIIERMDGRFWLRSAITPNNGSAKKLSPLVLLNTTT